jgi:hypothetical protein
VLLGFGSIALLTAGVLLWFRSDRDLARATVAPDPIPVIATSVQQRDVPIVLTGLGTVAALNTATIHSQITGLLISIDFQEGQFVKKGQLLAQIDPRTYQAQLDQAEATLVHDQTNLKNAQLNLQRYSSLAKENSIARQQVDDQSAAVDGLSAQIKSDQAAVESAKAYGHNGYFKSLKSIVHFYNTRDLLARCRPDDPGESISCWPPPESTDNINTKRVGRLGLSDEEENALISFMQTLTDGFMQRGQQ